MVLPWARDWRLRADTVYLNHGSFGLAPQPVLAEQRRWQQRMAEQPMDYFVRQYEPAWLKARATLAQFIGAEPDCVALLENATVAMNAVAAAFPLAPGDEVLVTDHEYGAVIRTWEQACSAADAHLVTAAIPWPLHDEHEIVEALFSKATDRTRLIVFSHITSPSALILPAALITEEARRRGIAVCIDGPHAVAQIPLSLRDLGCDFYTASCHKWLAAPLGSGFLYASPQWHDRLEPLVTSWGRLPPTEPRQWWERFLWRGTRDSTALLAIPAAIEYLRDCVGLSNFRRTTHALAQEARTRLLDRWFGTSWTPDEARWYGSMVTIPLPPGPARPLQQRLWEHHGIEVPIIEFDSARWIRVSCHLYNSSADLERLVRALEEEIEREPRIAWEVSTVPAGREP